MPDQKTPDTGSPAAEEQSGAGYGNNAQTDQVGKPGDEQEVEAHPS